MTNNNPLALENHPEFRDGDRVEVAVAGFLDNVVKGTIVGISSKNVLDFWVVLTDHQLPNWPYRTIVQQHTFIRREGSNEKFQCEFVIGRDFQDN